MRGVGSDFNQMSGIAQIHNSRDLNDESRTSFQNVEEAVGSNQAKWSALEPSPEKRGPRKDENVEEDCKRSQKAMIQCDGDGCYETRMSPGLDEWRRQQLHQSLKIDWKISRRSQSPCRSRSRSPIHVFKGESGENVGNRTRTSVSGQSHKPCFDFLKGTCWRGASCRFSHHDTSEASGKMPANEVIAGTRIVYNAPCNFFTAGNCRYGKNCRFSHHGQAHVYSSSNHIVVASDKKEAPQWMAGNTGDMEMSPIRSLIVQPPNYMVRKEHTSLPICEPGITLKASGQVRGSSTIMPPMIKETPSNQKDINSRVAGISAISPMSITACIHAAQSFNQSGPIKINKPDNWNANATRKNPAVTPLTVSFTRSLANPKQLPLILAAHDSRSGSNASPIINSKGSVKALSALAIQHNQVGRPHGQYDPICDRIESKEHNAASNHPPGFSQSLIRQKGATDGKLELSFKNLSPASHANKGHLLDHLGTSSNSEVAKNKNGVGIEEIGRVQEENKTAKGDGPSETNVANVRADEVKNKNSKGNRAFEFALVGFVKEQLNPRWREGSVSKDSFRNIVKKVVDKVFATMQASDIPQSRRRIEQYMSVAKPKLTKLVQAYLDKLKTDK